MPRKPNYPKKPTKLAEFIIARLEQSGITANDLAAETGISQSHLSDILHGKQSPKAPILNKLADHFKVSRLALYELVGWVKLDEKGEIFFSLMSFMVSKKLECSKYCCLDLTIIKDEFIYPEI